MNIKKILTVIFNHIKALFKDIPNDLKTAIHIGVVVTENLKKFIDSPVADALTAVIPGKIDDDIKAWLRLQLPLILIELKLADEAGNENDVVKQGIKSLNNLNGDIKNAFLHNISVLTALAASKNKLNWHNGVYILEWYYQKRYKPNLTNNKD